MTATVTIKAMVLSPMTVPSRDGQTNYYRLSLLDGVTKSAGELSCTEEVAKGVEPFKWYNLTGVYNNSYNPATLRITAAARIPDDKLK